MTVTDPEVTRFFMTVEEAVGLVLEAATMAEFGETFVLDMGDPVRIVDLVHNYAEMLHLGDVEIAFSGLRPGEKLTESVFAPGRGTDANGASEDLGNRAERAASGFRGQPRPALRRGRPQRLPSRLRGAAPDPARVPTVPGDRWHRLAARGRALDPLAAPYPDGF